MYNFDKLFSLSQQAADFCFVLLSYLPWITNKNLHIPTTKHNNNSHVTVSQTKPSPEKVSPVSWNQFQIRQIDCITPKNLKPVSVKTVYMIQPVVKFWQPVWQPCWTNSCSLNRLSNSCITALTNTVWQPIECLYTRYSRLSNRLSNGIDNRFDNRVERTAIRSTGCH